MVSSTWFSAESNLKEKKDLIKPPKSLVAFRKENFCFAFLLIDVKP